MKIIEENEVLLGKQKYTYRKDANGEETLSRNETINDKNIEIVLKNTPNQNTNEIEKFVTDVLSDLYIQRQIKKFS